MRQILVIFGVLGAMACAQTQNSPAASLVLNGVDSQAPMVVRADRGSTLTMSCSGTISKPFVLASAPNIQVGAQFVGLGDTVDIGPLSSISILMSGLDSPLINPLNFFASTGSTGTTTFSFPVSPTASSGSVAALQLFVIDFTAPGFVVASGATRLLIADSAPDVLISTGTNSFAAQTVRDVRGPQDITVLGVPANFEFRDIGLQRYGFLHANDETIHSGNPNLQNSPGGIDRHVPPTADSPRFFGTEYVAPFIRTVYGDIYQIKDLNTGTMGFLRVDGGVITPISETFLPEVTPGVSPWQKLVNINDNVMMAATLPSGGNGPRLFLIRIDGSLFPGSSSSVVDLTPSLDDTPSQIYAESFTFAGGQWWYVQETVPNLGRLFRVDPSGTSLPIAVSIPLISFSPLTLADRTFPEIFHDEPRARLYIKCSNAAGTTFAIYRVDGITPQGETVTLIPATISNTLIRDFGRASNGRSGHFSVSPDGVRIAWVVGGQMDIRTCLLTDTTSLLVTSGTYFAATIFVLNDLLLLDGNRLLFWAGTTNVLQDLYHISLNTGILTNITRTNGQDGSILPISASPAATLDATGHFVFGTRLIFYVQRPLSGPQTGQFGVDLAGVDLTNLQPYNITGNLFPGPSTPNRQVTRETYGPTFSANGTRIWLTSTSVDNSLGSELHSFDPALNLPAAAHLPAVAPGLASTAASVQIAMDGLSAVAVQRHVDNSGSSQVVKAHHFGPTQILVPPTIGIAWSDVRVFPDGAQEPGLFGIRHAASLANPFRDLVMFRENTMTLSSVTSLPPATSSFFLSIRLPD